MNGPSSSVGSLGGGVHEILPVLLWKKKRLVWARWENATTHGRNRASRKIDHRVKGGAGFCDEMGGEGG